MRLIGLLLFLFGAATLVLHFVEPGVEQLRWIDTWGEGVAWGIRGGSTGLGLLLLLTGRGKGAKKK